VARTTNGSFAANERLRGMTSQTDQRVENRRAVRRFIQGVLNDHDRAALDQFTENDRLRASVERFLTGFPDVRMAVEWIVAEAHKVVVWVRFSGTHGGPWRGVAPTGRTVAARGSIAFEMHGGRATDFWLCVDWLAMLQQLGAAPATDLVSNGSDQSHGGAR
jgi:predicted ester cyclase